MKSGKRRIKSWIDKHPAAWEFILFNVLSNVATFVNFYSNVDLYSFPVLPL